ncbi:hypothetical protein CEUSTIGMA_g7242.t1 [Chlamydomonas eustigma]|uniref:YqgE/AlgH family protein n=1 Tax=Chlamydomonas eustigma TaxID=1157962 RepID=A0A250XAB4_9CHLO|nr:hypothetical protein CEUSTIGMA_g7242.t1 [Chlamydomonas eustigma]|eukprot:GAX79802.1 hypothetical protein CEUSTIGMA_g7242.t1 [Chlamydomonas eustigma]
MYSFWTKTFGTTKASICYSRSSCYNSRLVSARSVQDDEPLELTGDWRSFRAKLIKSTASTTSEGKINQANLRRLELDSPDLAAEGFWCHPTSRPEKGGLLVASLKVSELKGNDRLEEVVAVLIEHGDQGSIGLILNRPTSMVMGKRPNGMPLQLSVRTSYPKSMQIHNAPPEVQSVFADNRLYCGGFTAQQVIHLLHGHPLPGAQEVVPGIFMGGELAAAKEVGEGRLRAEDFRFFAGALVWDEGELDKEAEKGCWLPVASSRALVLKQCLQLPTPLWVEVLQLLGGEYAQVAADADAEFEDDE